ncbi:MAG: cell division protein FtsQ/DivIB [Pseudomonadota bacterium]
MRPLSESRRGPGPSQFVYRIERLWKRPWVRRLGLSVLPAAVVLLAGWQVAISPRVQGWMVQSHGMAMDALSARPEFAVRGLAVTGASVDLTRRIEELVPITPGLSSLSLDVAAVKTEVEALGPVKTAHVALAASGTLRISLVERLPVVLWRDAEDRMWLMGDDGAVVAPAATRAGYPELPVLLGDAAPGHVPEALALIAAAPDIAPRMRALVYVGARRWDIVLDRGQRLLLPEDDPALALDRIVAWDLSTELLSRDVALVDMRLAERPVVRMTEEGAELYRLRQATPGAGERT